MTKPTRTGLSASHIAQLADQCVQCGLCLPHCPTYALDRTEAESPRGRIAYMKAVATGQIEATVVGDTHLDHCLGCRRCESACPADVPYGELLSASRAVRYSSRSPSLHDQWLGLSLTKPLLLRGESSLARISGYLPAVPRAMSKPALTHQHVEHVAIFEGCIAKTYESCTRQSLSHLLDACGISVATVTSQTCCGTAAAHQGDTHTVQQLTKKNREAFPANLPIINLATGCHEQLKKSLAAHTEVTDAFDFLWPHRHKLLFKPAQQRVALHIPCTQSTIVKSASALRNLLSLVPELDIFELPDRGCCGAAGLHMLNYPARANAMREPFIEMVQDAEVTQLLSANIGCRLHIANACKLRVRHPIDFLAEHLL